MCVYMYVCMLVFVLPGCWRWGIVVFHFLASTGVYEQGGREGGMLCVGALEPAYSSRCVLLPA